MYITTKIRSNGGILKRLHVFQRGARQGVTLGMELVKEQESQQQDWS